MTFMTVSESRDGDFMPIAQYDAKAGRAFRVDKDDTGSTKVDITRSFKAVFDFEQVEIGYILFAAGQAPDFRLVPYGQPMPERPVGTKHKQGLRLRVKLARECGGDVRELAGTSRAFLTGINAVHDEYLKLAPSNPGKLPVLVLQDTIRIETVVKGQKLTNYQPVFSIAGWALRPADMPLNGAPAPATNGNGAARDAAVGRASVDVAAHHAAAAATNDANRAANLDDFG